MMIIKRKKSRKLDLSSKNLNRFPSSIFNDKNIVRLDLSNNNIQDIPAYIGILKKLRYLNLENNNIQELHSGVTKLQSIKTINLKGNPIKRLPDFIKKKLHANILTDDNNSLSSIDAENEKLLKEIQEEIHDINSHKTTFEPIKVVPSLNDLTFIRSKDRKAKELKSCTLFIDIRDSVKKNHELCTQALANIYSSFIYGVLKCAMSCYGHVRNIIGDRVMIVFDEEDCCNHALNCANLIMNFIYDIMQKETPDEDFDCGIGIHYGIMNIIKVGLTLQGKENQEYQNMVWLGEPANLASRLTDKAGKDDIPHILISEAIFKRARMSLKKDFTPVPIPNLCDVDFNVYGKK